MFQAVKLITCDGYTGKDSARGCLERDSGQRVIVRSHIGQGHVSAVGSDDAVETVSNLDVRE